MYQCLRVTGPVPARLRSLRILLLAALLSVSLLPAGSTPALALTFDTSSDYNNIEMLSALNTARVASGVPTVVINANLVKAARAHARYIDLNGGKLTHAESAGSPGFTGTGPSERALAAGYSSGVGEVIASLGAGGASVSQLLATVYHRHLLLDPDVFEVGFGGGSVGVINTGYNWKGSSVSRYPAKNATGIPVRWIGNETPDPMEGLSGPFGPPITLVYANTTGTVTLRSATLAGPTGAVAVKTEVWGSSKLSATPFKPLLPSATYRITFDVTIKGVESRESWLFSTASGVLEKPSGLWVERGAYGRILHWSAPLGGPRPQYYSVRGAEDLVANIVSADQLYWVDTDPARTKFLTVSAHYQGESTYNYIYSAANPAVNNYYASKWVSQSPYPTLAPGEITTLEFDFRNSGTVPWARGIWGSQVNLGLNGDNKEPYLLGMDVNWLWDDRVATTTEARIEPGAVGRFVFSFRAPKTPGVYRFSIRPVMDGTTWLVDEGVFLTITVR